MSIYGLYQDIDENSVSSSIHSIEEKIIKSSNNLVSFKESLVDDIWTADSKSNIINFFTNIDSVIYNDIKNNLVRIQKICSLISTYKSNEKAAKENKNKIVIARQNNLSTTELEQVLYNQEKEMENCINQISNLGGV